MASQYGRPRAGRAAPESSARDAAHDDAIAMKRHAAAPAARRLRRVLFVSQRRAEAMRAPRAAALISITDPARGPAALGDGWRAVLRVSFDDLDEVTIPGWNDDLQAISADQVADIAAFAAAASRSCLRIVVHCRHGVSRSAAVAKAIAQAAGVPFPEHYRRYNRYVYLALRGAMRFAFERT